MRPGPSADGLGSPPPGLPSVPGERSTALVGPPRPRASRPRGPADDLWVWAGRVLGSSSFRLAVLYNAPEGRDQGFRRLSSLDKSR